MRPAFAFVLVIATLFGVYRIPYQSVVEAVGHFKQTRNGAFLEALLNVVLSVALVRAMGLVGVAIGTLCAMIFRTFQYYIYMSRRLVKRSLWPLIKRLLLSALTFAMVILLSRLLCMGQPETYLQWALQAIPVALAAACITVGIEAAFYQQDLQLTTKKIFGALFSKK